MKAKTQDAQVSNTFDEKKQFSHNEGTLIGDAPGISWGKFDGEQIRTGLNTRPGNVDETRQRMSLTMNRW